MKTLPVVQAAQLAEVQTEHPWLIEPLWSVEAVGIVGGEPKCCKSFLALDMAVAVASGAPCLRRYPVRRTGSVLLYPAEDALGDVHRRLQGICDAAQTDLPSLPIHVITAARLRLDRAEDRQRLSATVETVKPVMLILDPFIRLHRIDENVACEVAPLLSFLRELQRRFHTAVVLVHHAKKGAGALRGGQALRGSSELHGWGDANLYVARKKDRLWLSAEHRAAPSMENIPIRLETQNGAPALRTEQPPTPQTTNESKPSCAETIRQVMTRENKAFSVKQLRGECRMRAAVVGRTLKEMIRRGNVVKDSDGYRWNGANAGSRSRAL